MRENASHSNPGQTPPLAEVVEPSPQADTPVLLRLTRAGHEAALQQPYGAFMDLLESRLGQGQSRGKTQAATPRQGVALQLTHAEGAILAGHTAVPPVVSIIRESTVERYLMHLEPGDPWISGHFENEPILPGIMQLHWAAVIAGGLLRCTQVPRQVSRLKFRHIAAPPRLVELRLDLERAPRVSFQFHSHPHPHAQGVLHYDGSD